MNSYLKTLLPLVGGVALIAFAGNAHAFVMLPQKPTSADQLQLVTIRGACFTDFNPSGVNPYNVAMKNQHITITFNKAQSYVPRDSIVPVPLSPTRLRFIDVGKLPAGQYTWSVEDENPIPGCAEKNTNGAVPKNQSLTVTDARAVKAAPYPLVDVSGHWWSPDNPGAALFLWHDEKDRTLGAWLTYDNSGAAKWYVFEPKWTGFEGTLGDNLYEAARVAGNALPAQGKTELKLVGKAGFTLEGEYFPANPPSVSVFNTGQRLIFGYQFMNEALTKIVMQRYPAVPQR